MTGARPEKNPENPTMGHRNGNTMATGSSTVSARAAGAWADRQERTSTAATRMTMSLVDQASFDEAGDDGAGGWSSFLALGTKPLATVYP